MDLFNLKGKTALVTGASSGIGRRMCECLAEAGATIIAAARRTELLEELCTDIRARGGTAFPLTLDVSEEGSVTDAMQWIASENHMIDILINDAGMGGATPIFDEEAEDKFAAQIQINTLGVWFMTKAVARHMKNHAIHGSIINISSVLGADFIRSHTAGYSASKAAVIQMTKSLVSELAKEHIRINAILPGYVTTPMTKIRTGSEKRRAETAQRIPLGFVADPKDLDGAVLFLASNNASAYVSGCMLTIDGGMSYDGSLNL